MEEKIRETELSELEKVNNVCDMIVEDVEKEISEEEITKCVIKNAKKIGYDYESLSEKEQEKLRKIERIVQAKFALEKKAKAMASRNVVSVQGISKEADISRQTFYNNPIYKEYILSVLKSSSKLMLQKMNITDGQAHPIRYNKSS